MLVARLGLAALLLAGAAIAAVSLGIDKWAIHTMDSKLFITGLRCSCTVTGCLANDYSVATTTFGNCTVSTQSLKSLNTASWGISLAGVLMSGLGALFVAISSFFGLVSLTLALVVCVLGHAAYVVGGGLAYNTQSSWVFCGLTFCDQYYAQSGVYCLSEQGPSFVLWCIAIAVCFSGSIGCAWLLSSDMDKAALLKLKLRKSRYHTSHANTSPRGGPRAASPRRSHVASREPVPPSQPTAPTTTILVPPGYAFHPESGMYYSTSEATFFDQITGHYFSATHNAWYNPDTKQWYVREQIGSPS